jgi:type IV pilus assembly protein PilA
MSVIKCPNCNLVNFAGSISCKRCGYAFAEINQPEIGQPAVFQAQPNYPPPSPVQPGNWNQPNHYQPHYQSGYSQTSQQSKKLAIISLILGILSFPMVNMLIGGLLAVVLALVFGTAGAVIGFLIALSFLPSGLVSGIVALVRANKRPNEFGGKGFAITGIVLSGFAIVFIPLIAAIAVPNLLAARRAANEGSAISSLRNIALAQVKFSAVSQRCGNFSELKNANQIDSVLATGTKSGYIFTISQTPDGCDIFAKPLIIDGVSATGNRTFFYSTQDGMLRATKEKNIFPDQTSPIVEDAGFPPSQAFTRRIYKDTPVAIPTPNPEFRKTGFGNQN